MTHLMVQGQTAKSAHWIILESEKEVHVLPIQAGHVLNKNCFCFPDIEKRPDCRNLFIHEEVRGDGKEK